MQLFNRLAFATLLCVVLLMVSASALPADGIATFGSFYQQSLGVSWLWAGLAAAMVGILVFIGWPILGPAMTATVGTIGTAIGGLMGLSGIAATNAGLALLGGGAIASGGFGIIGGTALLSAALTFSTEVTLDYALGAVINNYQANQFADASLKMMTLPLPVNTSGPASVRAAGDALQTPTIQHAWKCVQSILNKSYSLLPASGGTVHYVSGRFVPTDSQHDDGGLAACIAAQQKPPRQLVRDALAAMQTNLGPLSGTDVERENATYALLYFLDNNYSQAKRYASKAYKQGINSGGTPSLPAFVFAASLLYDNDPNLNDVIAKFGYSLAVEPDNPLTPVMYSVLLDRLSYRLNDGAVGVDAIDRLATLAAKQPDDFRKLAIQQTLLAHALKQIKLSQQRVLSLTRSENRSVIENPRTLEVVEGSLNDYSNLLIVGNALLKQQNRLIERLTANKPWWQIVKDGGNPFKSVQVMLASNGWPAMLKSFERAMAEYQRTQSDLEATVVRYETERAQSTFVSSAIKSRENQHWSLIGWIKGLFK